MKRLLSSISALAILSLAACSNSNTSTTLPSTIPTTIPSSIAATIDQQVCDIQAQALSIIGQIQATTLQSPGDLAAQLKDMQTQLQDRANALESQGATPLADQVAAWRTPSGSSPAPSPGTIRPPW
jgi:hypothetical protein